MTDLPATAWPETPPAAPAAHLPATADVEVGIIGAGIHGAALARELALRGVSHALVDIGGVGGGTSQWSSQLLHGGIRYLRTGDIGQMREGLAERATWMRIAPWRCRWEAFWMPHAGLWEGFTHRVGIWLYDRWWGRNRPGWPAGLRLGGVPRTAFAADPRSEGGVFRGAVAYADLMTDDRDLTRDLAASADGPLFDYHEVIDWQHTADTLQTAMLRDRRDGSERRLAARRWVAALGPWNDGALRTWLGEDEPDRLRLSAGIHLWFDAIPGADRPWAVIYDRTRILFAIPRDGMLQVGTTEREVATGAAPVMPEEREELFAALARLMPGIDWRNRPIRYEESGVRPLVLKPGDTTRLSREARLDAHPRFANLRLVLGGKLTTARALMDVLATQLTGARCPQSHTTPLIRYDVGVSGA